MKDIKVALKEAELHLDHALYDSAKILEKGLNNKHLKDKDYVILLDAFIFRFIKLQSSVSEKLFPQIYEHLTGKDYTEATFIDILNTLEKYRVIPSTEEWKEIRKLRNEFVHIYPWETELKLRAVGLAIEKLEIIKKVMKRIEELAGD